MRILLSTIGSRGDVQPLVALALQLKALGQEVRLCVPPDFREWIEGLGLPVIPIGPEVRSFAVAADGSTSGRKDFVSVSSPDGFGMDCLGNLYVASGGNAGALQVYAPSGTKLGSLTVASSLSNAAFGGSDGMTLYLTAGKALYSLDMNLPGYYY